MKSNEKGKLVLIGGGEDRKGDKLILKEIVRLSGGSRGIIALFTAASQEPAQGIRDYEQAFLELGAEEVFVLPVNNRREASNRNNIDCLSKATALFMTGGDQLRLTSILGGTLLEKELHSLYQKGRLVICGTSAGASVMSDTMLVGGEGEEPPRKEGIAMAPGLRFLSRAVVDQHFAQRGRINRLLTVLAHNPGILGIGIDENTAVIIRDGCYLEVIGEQGVTLLDGRTIEAANVTEQAPGRALAITGITLHVLKHGCGYNLADRKPLPL